MWKIHRRRKKILKVITIIISIIVLFVMLCSGTKSFNNFGITTIFKKADNTSSETSNQTIQKLSDVVKVGDYVQYDANSCGTYTYSIDDSTSGISNNPIFKSSDKMKWRVLSVDRLSGKVELVPETGTPQTVEFEEKDGIKNFIKILNDISAVYGHGYGATSARSINVDDIQKYAPYTPIDSKTIKVTDGIIFEDDQELDVSEIEGGVEFQTNIYAYGPYSCATDTTALDVILKRVGAMPNENPYKQFFIATRLITGGNNIVVYYCMCFKDGGVQPTFYYQSNGAVHYYNSNNSNSYPNNLPVLPIVELDTNLQVSGKDDNGWIIYNQEDNKTDEFIAQVELSKVSNNFDKIAGSTFKVQDISENSHLEYEIYNATSREKVELGPDNTFIVPDDGIIMDLKGEFRNKNYQLKISEISAPDGKERSLNHLVLDISVSTEDIVTAKIIEMEDINGESVSLPNENHARIKGANEEGEVQIGIDDTYDDLDIEYHLGDEPKEGDTWLQYDGQLELQENAKIWARTKNKNNNKSSWAIKVVNNIDKIAPTIDRDTLNIQKDETSRTSSLSVKIKDEASEDFAAQDLNKYGASGIIAYGLSMSKEEEPREKIEIENLLESNISIDGIVNNGTYYLWIWDAAGNIGKEEIEINFTFETYVAQIVSVTAQDGSEKYDYLINTKYTTLRSAIDACPTLNDGTATIKIIANIVNESNDVDRDVTIDLAGFSVNTESFNNETPTLNVKNNCKLYVTDSVGSGYIRNKKSDFTGYDGEAIGIQIEENGFLQLGDDDGIVSDSIPCIIGEGYGVYNKGRTENEEWIGGDFNFYDGKIIAYPAQISDVNVNLATYGNVTDTPLLYKVNITNEKNPDVRQVATLAAISDAEVRIGKKTYTQIEDAITDAGTKYGTNGSQVEIILVDNLSKKKTVVIDDTKNIKLNLDGHTFTTQSNGYVIENHGNLEIVDSKEDEQTGKIYSTTGDVIYNVDDSVEPGTETDVNISEFKLYDDSSSLEHGYFELDLTENERYYI